MNIIFSPEDEDLAKLNWHKHTGGYANRWSGLRSDRYKVLAHRVVLERKLGRQLAKGELTDHINRNKLDNRRENLRLANKSLNTINRDTRPDNTTGYIGVYLCWPRQWQEGGWAKRWSARVQRDGKVRYLGYYKSPLEAHLAREKYLSSLHQ